VEEPEDLERMHRLGLTRAGDVQQAIQDRERRGNLAIFDRVRELEDRD
jgi:hypothetical protein